MATISLCMIVKNEELTLERCLNSVKNIVDEIVIVDTGSSDRTKEIALSFTEKVIDFKWIDDFSAARNFSFEQATMDYIMWLDADDVILQKDGEKLASLKKNLYDTDVVMMKYNTAFDIQGNVTFSYYRERLVKRSRNFRWTEPVHEYIATAGVIVNSDICITHEKKHTENSDRNIRIYETIINSGKEFSPRGIYYYARELREHGRFLDAIKWFNLFLNLRSGWLEDNICACAELAKCCKAEKKHDDILTYLFKSFEYDTPRAEICCDIGYYFKEKNDYKMAVFWFELATSLNKPAGNWGFISDDCWGYIPTLECAVCYDKLGDYKKASYFNEKAALYKPDSPAVSHNRKYFEKIQDICKKREV